MNDNVDLKNYNNWSNHIKEIEHSKRNLEWGSNPKPNIISHKFMKERENIFNPVSQQYHNDNLRNSIIKSEKEILTNEIAKNYDKALRIQQTYDIINLKDKFKAFQGHPDYPHNKGEENIKKKLESSHVNYNILSNITLDKHNFLPPEKRPVIETLKHVKENPVQAKYYKDYDLLSNNYKRNHEDKIKVDKQIAEFTSAKNYWKTHDYDLINGKFFDNHKEEEFKQKRQEDSIKQANKKPLGKE